MLKEYLVVEEYLKQQGYQRVPYYYVYVCGLGRCDNMYLMVIIQEIQRDDCLCKAPVAQTLE